MKRRERKGASLLAGAVVVAFLFLTAQATGEDQMEELVQTAKAAWGKKDFKQAAAAYEVAWAKEPARLDLLLRTAESYEKASCSAAALHAYRALLSACDEQANSSGANAASKAASRKALKKIKSLGKVEAQERALCDRRAKKLVDLAKKCAPDAPLVALRAFERAAVLGADSSVYGALLRSLRSRVDRPADRVASPFEDRVRTWTDLLEPETFPTHKGWTFGEDGLVIDAKGGGSHLAANRKTSNDPYVYEMEVRTKKGYASLYVVGLLISREGNRGLSVWMGPLSVEVQSFLGSETGPVGVIERSLKKLDTWHRLSVLVKDGTLGIWIDGEELATYKIPDGWSQTGQYGLTTQDGLFEIRQLRMGVLK